MERLSVIRKQLGAAHERPASSVSSDTAHLTISAEGLSGLKFILDNDNHETREKIWKMVENDKQLFVPKFNIPLPLQRDTAYRQLKRICDLKLLSVHDFDDNPRKIFTAHECIAILDTSTATKMTVQFNLFGGTVLRLGTEKHHKILGSVDRFEQVGCFALTEVGYGNNAVEMECTATYDNLTDEFVINTPSRLSKKFWITNGALHAHWCVVFAQLMIHQTNHGVHPFLVRIRDNHLAPLAGVTIQDMGLKMGSNGVDNAEISFHHFRAPRDSLLNSVSNVEKGGKFSSSVSTRRERFITQTDQLLSGRLCLASMALGASKACLCIAVRYSLSRMGVGPNGKSDTPIASYQFQRQALLPLIADTFAMTALLTATKDVYAHLNQKGTGRRPINNKKTLQLHCLLMCCAAKPMISWHGCRTASVCRERCGGQGYLTQNLFGEYISASHACMTAEGDNCVLWQKTAKELLSVFGSEPYDNFNKLWGRVSNGRVPLGSKVDGEFLTCLLARREGLKLTELQRKMAAATDRRSVFQIWMMQESKLIQSVAAAFAERNAVDALHAMHKDPETYTRRANAQQSVADPSVRRVIEAMLELFGCGCVERDAVWFTVSGELTVEDVKKIVAHKHVLLERVSPLIRELVECFNIPDHCLFAPIAHDWEKLH